MSEPIRIAGPDQLLDFLPRWIGFRPEDSMVVVLTTDTGVPTATLRFDRADYDEHSGEACATVLAAARNGGGRRGIVFVVTDPAHREVGEAQGVDLFARLSQGGLTVLDVIVTDGHQWGSALCLDDSCDCGGPAPDWSGFPTRAAMVDDMAAGGSTSTLDDARAWQLLATTSGESSSTWACRVAASIVAGLTGDTVDDAACLAAVRFMRGRNALPRRDLLLRLVADDTVPLPAWKRVATLCGDDDDVALSAVAVGCYLARDGAATWAAVDRVRPDSDGAAMAAMVAAGISFAATPEMLREMLLTLPADQLAAQIELAS